MVSVTVQSRHPLEATSSAADRRVSQVLTAYSARAGCATRLNHRERATETPGARGTDFLKTLKSAQNI